VPQRPFPITVRLARRALAVASLGAICLTPGPTHAQEPEAPTVTLASPQTPPEGETFITIMLTNVPGQPVRVLKTQVEFHDRELIYITARTSFAADVAGGQLDVATQNPAQAAAAPDKAIAPTPLRDGKSRVILTITGRKPLANGPIAEMRFRVAPELGEGAPQAGVRPSAPAAPPSAPPETPEDPALVETEAEPQVLVVKVDHLSAAWGPDGSRIAGLVSEPGEIRVTTANKDKVPIVFGCFFYMH
jgi:hypothetical protein